MKLIYGMIELKFNLQIFLLVILFFISCTNNKTISENIENENIEILSNQSPGGNYINLNVLVKFDNPDSLINYSKIIHHNYCRTKTCNVVNYWSNKDAFDLYVTSKEISFQNNKKWKNKNWPKICESNIAEENGNSLSYYPMMSDSFEYKKYGGSKERSEIVEISLNTKE